ncbi:glycogen-binding domain-containing protein [bacterium]|nr:glycogen-binding domain-containing protein [bacterium]
MSKVRFEVSLPEVRKVYIAGDFNDWDATARQMKRVRKGEDLFVAVLDLEPGVYEYKYVADDVWRCCPTSPRVPNNQGTENSVVEVPE